MKKRVIIALLIMSLLTSFSITANSTFTDIKTSNWYYENVNTLVEEGIINGYGDGTFGPENTMTAEQFIKTMVVALGHDLENGSVKWSQPFIDKALDLGIIEQGDFADYAVEITRAQMAKLVVEVVELLEGTKTYEYNTTTGSDLLLAQIADRHLIGDTTTESYVSKSYELGIITGYDTGAFKPNTSLKRSEACTVIRRVIDEAQRSPYVPKEQSEEERALTEAFGYAPLTNGGSNGIVFTKDMIMNVEVDFNFISGVTFNNERREGQGKTWSLLYSGYSVEKYNNAEMQLYEVAFILKNVINCSDETIEAVKAHLIQKTTDTDIVDEAIFYNKDGKSFLSKGSSKYDWDIEIVGYDLFDLFVEGN